MVTWCPTKIFGPDRFSRFDVYWIQTNRQTPKQTDKPNLYIDKGRGGGTIFAPDPSIISISFLSISVVGLKNSIFLWYLYFHISKSPLWWQINIIIEPNSFSTFTRLQVFVKFPNFDDVATFRNIWNLRMLNINIGLKVFLPLIKISIVWVKWGE